jgi:hypothetical protein
LDCRILGDDGPHSTGFVDEDGTIINIDPFGSTFTQALGVNNLGEIVGFYTDSAGAAYLAIHYSCAPHAGTTGFPFERKHWYRRQTRRARVTQPPLRFRPIRGSSW